MRGACVIFHDNECVCDGQEPQQVVVAWLKCKVWILLENYEYSVVEPGTSAYADYLALRHDVFCAELGRIAPDGRHLSGLSIETDDYDVHSLHVLCRVKATGRPAGCSRLILPGPKGLNVSARYKLAGKLDVPEARVGEIGRLALATMLRRARSDASGAGLRQRVVTTGHDSIHSMLKREGPVVALGLYREIFNLANRYGITHCYAAMEPALARLFNRLGFPFQEAGPLNGNVSPARQPYLIGAQSVREGLAARNSCLYQFMFGGVESPRQALHTEAAWSISGEAGAYQDAGLHI